MTVVGALLMVVFWAVIVAFVVMVLEFVASVVIGVLGGILLLWLLVESLNGS